MKTILVGHKGVQSLVYLNVIPVSLLDSLKDFGDFVAAME